ncbi:MAG: hypothetical protein ACLQIB_08505 [Isosphaeraceae bacterium]
MKWIRCLVVTTVWLGWSSPAYAGMPFVTLSDLARMRFQVISFFVLALLLATWVIQRIWNGLRGDFPRLPRLSYKRALGLVTLWGLLFVLILTMISGARELMTPGAWKKQGFTYALADGPDKKDQSRAELLDSQNNEVRREALARLNRALSLYAQNHEGRFPLRDDVPEIYEVLWRIPDYPSMRYIYIPGLKRDVGPYVLAYEPGILGPNRWVLLTDGTVRQMTLPQIRHAIAPSPDSSDRPIKAEARGKR